VQFSANAAKMCASARFEYRAPDACTGMSLTPEVISRILEITRYLT
jgi:hypothetical protein